MLTSFFSKSGPQSFLVVALYMGLFYSTAAMEHVQEWNLLVVVKKFAGYLLLLLTVVLLNFVSRRNDLTSRNAYKTVLFAGFTCAFTDVFRNLDAIAANFFILLAIRRIISMRSGRETIKKIFDATLWIGVASVLYFWSVSFLSIVFVGIVLHSGNKFKNWLIPLVALLVLLSLVTTSDLIWTDTFYIFSEWFEKSSFDFSKYRELPILVPLAFILALTLWSSVLYFGTVQRGSTMNKRGLFMIFVVALVSLATGFFAPTKNSSELLFLFAPLAIISTNYFQITDDRWFKETVLWFVVLLPGIVLFLQ